MRLGLGHTKLPARGHDVEVLVGWYWVHGSVDTQLPCVEDALRKWYLVHELGSCRVG